MAMQSLEQLFAHGLKDMYAEEQELLTALDDMEEEDVDQELQQTISTHKEETQQHVDRLEQMFDTLGTEPEAEGGQGLAGIIEEHNSFMQSEPTEQINTVYDTNAAKKVERYEITAYEDLMKMGKAMGLSDDEMRPLEENLSDERRQLDRLDSFAHNFDMGQLNGQ